MPQFRQNHFAPNSLFRFNRLINCLRKVFFIVDKLAIDVNDQIKTIQRAYKKLKELEKEKAVFKKILSLDEKKLEQVGIDPKKIIDKIRQLIKEIEEIECDIDWKISKCEKDMRNLFEEIEKMTEKSD